MTEPLTYEILANAVAGASAAIRCVTRLQPAGGPGDKVFPPTFLVGKKASYASEKRRIDGRDVDVVLLDSVASQANRLEEALFDAWESRTLEFPVIGVDFSGSDGVSDVGLITTLHAPHRIADAILRDAETLDGTSFRQTPAGKAYTEASPRSATAVYQLCPTALLLGVWDSTGPKGGGGAKFQRALVSEIVGIGMVPGVKSASRIDPLGIQSGVEVYHAADNEQDWTVDAQSARKEKDKPVLFSRSGGDGKKGKPSSINHSNVAPTIDDSVGGVTFDYAVQTTVLSLPALRRLRLQTSNSGASFPGETRLAAEHAARTALAALALAGVALLRTKGFDLRSRSLLVPEGGHAFELEFMSADGGAPSAYSLSAEQAVALVARTQQAAAAFDLAWEREPVRLRPAQKLVDLIRRSRALAPNDADVGEND